MWCLTVGGLSPWKEFSQSLESTPQYIFAYIGQRNLPRSVKLWPTKKFTDIRPQKLPGAKIFLQLILCPKLSPAPRKRSAAELFRPKKGEKRLWGIGSPNQPTPSPSAVTSWSRIFRPSASSADTYLPCRVPTHRPGGKFTAWQIFITVREKVKSGTYFVSIYKMLGIV